MAEKQYLTQERFDELKQELEMLKTQKRREIADALKLAKEYGDLSENSEYAEARQEQAQVEARIFELDDILKKASIIKAAEGGAVVGVGSRLTVKKSGKEFQYWIVGSNESKPEEGRISNESPIGRAFLGRRAGEKVNVATPVGTVEYEITKID